MGMSWDTFWAIFSQTHQGSMLWSPISAIFLDFRQNKLAFFSKADATIQFLNDLAML
jgi:hypothetical protein